MPDNRYLLNRLAADLSNGLIQQTSSCSALPQVRVAGPVSDVTLRYCAPAQRVEEDWHGSFLRLDGNGSV